MIKKKRTYRRLKNLTDLKKRKRFSIPLYFFLCLSSLNSVIYKPIWRFLFLFKRIYFQIGPIKISSILVQQFRPTSWKTDFKDKGGFSRSSKRYFNCVIKRKICPRASRSKSSLLFRTFLLVNRYRGIPPQKSNSQVFTI